jgi:hypothetical protein
MRARFIQVICRGNKRQVIFRGDADREYHLDRDWKSFGNAMPLRFILMCGCIVISSIIAYCILRTRQIATAIDRKYRPGQLQ